MGKTVEFGCRCGAIHGRVKDASPRGVNRVVCYCDDCQAFLHHLDRADLLDPHGGSDIVQVAPASLTFDRGEDRIAAVRLSPKGLYRWYASCCGTPIGNTAGPGLPFVGLVAQLFVSTDATPDELFGKPLGAIFGQFAIGTPPPGSTKLNLRLLARSIGKIAGWRLGGKSWPHPFFDRSTRAPSHAVTVLPRDRRDALRAQCGPRA